MQFLESFYSRSYDNTKIYLTPFLWPHQTVSPPMCLIHFRKCVKLKPGKNEGKMSESSVYYPLLLLTRPTWYSSDGFFQRLFLEKNTMTHSEVIQAVKISFLIISITFNSNMIYICTNMHKHEKIWFFLFQSPI